MVVLWGVRFLMSEVPLFAGADLPGRVTSAIHPGDRVCSLPAPH